MLSLLLFAVASTAIGPGSLRLSLATLRPPGVMHVSRASHIEFDVTVHKPLPKPDGSSIEVEPPEADFENRDPRFFENRPGPNVELHVVRVDGNLRTAVPIRIWSSGGGGSIDTDYTSIQIAIIAPDKEAMLQKMVACLIAATGQKLSAQDANGLRKYVENLIIDNPSGTYEITASYRATNWPARTPPLVSPPLVVVVDDGVDGYQMFCDRMRDGKKVP
jgi:hypothetical protein